MSTFHFTHRRELAIGGRAATAGLLTGVPRGGSAASASTGVELIPLGLDKTNSEKVA